MCYVIAYICALMCLSKRNLFVHLSIVLYNDVMMEEEEEKEVE